MNDEDESPEGWAVTTLEHLGQWQTGGTPSRKRPEYFGGTIPWIKSGDLKDGPVLQTEEFITQDGLNNSAAKLLPCGTLSVALYGATIGKLGILNIEAATNQACANCRVDESIANKCLVFYYLLGQRQALIDAGQGGAQPNLSNQIVREWPFPLPPLAEQKRIVAKVETLLARVHAARQRLAKVPALLKRFRQSVLAAACSGKLTEDWRSAQDGLESATDLLERLKQLSAQREECGSRKRKTNHREDSVTADGDLELFEIPDAWCWVKIRNIMDDREAFCYGVVQPGANDDDGVPLIRAGDLEQGTVDTTALRRIPVAVDTEYRRSKVTGGELLVTVVGAGIGSAAIIPDSCEGFNIARAVAKIPVREFSSKYVLAWLQSSVANQWMKEASREVARPTLNLEQLETLPVPLPPLAEQHEIVRRVEALLARADRIEKRLATATRRVETLTQAILAQAFRGELVPTEAELARQEGRDYEPAAVLLQRIRGAGGSPAKKSRRTPTKSVPGSR